MTVGELSRRTAVPVKALREYHDLGLIYSVGRSAANYRLFDKSALWCKEFEAAYAADLAGHVAGFQATDPRSRSAGA